MGILVLLGSMLHRKPDTINNLGISAFILLICNPYTIVDIGFWLSYGGTIGIVLLGDKITNVLYQGIVKITKGKINFLKKKDDDGNNITNKKLSKDVEDNDIKSKKENWILQKGIQYIVISFSITFSANLIIIPIMAYCFSTVSVTFWIANILAAPIMEMVTILGFLIYFISIIFYPFAQFLGIFLNVLLSILLKIAELTSFLPGSSIYIKTPYILECIIYYFLLFIILNFSDIKIKIKNHIKYNIMLTFTKKYKKFILFIFIILSVFSSIIRISSPKTLIIYFVDVGQGDCTLIKTPSNKHILIDGGGSEFGSFDVGKNTLLPYLLDRRITTIEYLLISHFDSDHIRTDFFILWKI